MFQPGDTVEIIAKNLPKWPKGSRHRVTRRTRENEGAYVQSRGDEWIDGKYIRLVEDSPAETISDPINPTHYERDGMECIDAIEAMVKGWPPETALRLGTAMAYIFRHVDKNGLEDLRKAEWYLKREIEQQEKEQGK